MSTQITPEQVAALASQNRGPEILAVSWVFTSLAIIVVSLKLFTRTYILHGLGWDDFFIFLSLVSILLVSVKDFTESNRYARDAGIDNNMYFNLHIRCSSRHGQTSGERSS